MILHTNPKSKARLMVWLTGEQGHKSLESVPFSLMKGDINFASQGGCPVAITIYKVRFHHVVLTPTLAHMWFGSLLPFYWLTFVKPVS